MNKIKKIISFIISLILMILLFISSFLIFFKYVAVNEKYYISVSDKINVTDSIYNDINLNLKSELIKNNIIINNNNEILNKDVIEELLKENYKNIFVYLSGKDDSIKSINTEKCIQNVDNIIQEYFNNSIDENVTDIINKVNNKCDKIVKDKVDYIGVKSILGVQVGGKIQSVLNIINNKYLLPVFFIIIAILSIILMIIWRKNFLKGIYYLATSVMTVGLLLFAIFVGGYYCKAYNGIMLFNGYKEEFIIKVISGYFVNYIKISCIYIVVGLILSIIYWIGLYKNNNYSKKVFNE